MGELAVGDHLPPLLALALLQQALGDVQVHQLLLEHKAPDLPDARVGFRLVAAPVQPAFGVLVHQQVLQPAQVGVQQAAVLGHVLLLHHADLLVQPLARLLWIVRRHVHIIVHGLLLGGGDDVGRKHVQRGRICAGHGVADGVIGVAMVGDGGTAGHDLGVAAHQVLRLLAGLHVQIVRIAVEVVEVLQQRKVQRILQPRVAHALGEVGRQIHRQLLVADGVLQHRLVQRLQVAQELLLLLLAAADQRKLAANLVVHRVPGELVGEPHVFKFRAVHQDQPRAGVGIHAELVVGLRAHRRPVQDQLGLSAGPHLKRIHKASLLWA